jgi:RNA polymerase sigma-70 factor, ECF subfamily
MYVEDFDLETALLARLRQGDEAALAELYERLSAKVLTLVFNMLHSREEAEEVLQDTFYKLFSGTANFTTWDRSPRAFIYTMARNEAISRLRKRQARPQKADEFDVHDPDLSLAVEAEATETTSRLWLEKALEQLPEDDRKLLEDCYFLGYSHAELVDMTQMPLGTIKSKIRRALQKLKGCLEPDDEDRDDVDSDNLDPDDATENEVETYDTPYPKRESHDHA